MERLRCLLAVLTTSVLLWALAVALPSQTNVDTREPSVIRSPASLDPGDGFGWSAVFHQREAVVDSDEPDDLLRKIRIVIGAPKGTFPGGLTTLEDYFEPAENRTGLVYSCTVRGMCVGVQGNTSLYAATEAITNGAARLGGTDDVVDFYQPELSEGRLFDQAPNTVNLGSANVFERKSGQLMGSSLYSSGDNILACAPLRNTIEGQPRGICFLGDRTLSNFKTVYPCSKCLRTVSGKCSPGGVLHTSCTTSSDQITGSNCPGQSVSEANNPRPRELQFQLGVRKLPNLPVTNLSEPHTFGKGSQHLTGRSSQHLKSARERTQSCDEQETSFIHK